MEQGIMPQSEIVSTYNYWGEQRLLDLSTNYLSQDQDRLEHDQGLCTIEDILKMKRHCQQRSRGKQHKHQQEEHKHTDRKWKGIQKKVQRKLFFEKVIFNKEVMHTSPLELLSQMESAKIIDDAALSLVRSSHQSRQQARKNQKKFNNLVNHAKKKLRLCVQEKNTYQTNYIETQTVIH